VTGSPPPRHRRGLLLIELGDTEICKTSPGLDEDLHITADVEAFVKWHAGQLTWAQAIRENRIHLDGSWSLVRAFPTWNARSMFAHVRPISRTATSRRPSMESEQSSKHRASQDRERHQSS
jgi:hypothetical protein